jgi:hypothetical protein
MLKRMNAAVGIAALAATCAIPAIAAERDLVTPRPQDKATLRQEAVEQLLPLVANSKEGTICKQDWLKQMEAEFDRLDRDKNGVLNVKQISQGTLRRPYDMGK